MVSMKMSDEERLEYQETTMAPKPLYPYGLKISLDDDALEKLGLKALPVDTVVYITAKAQVVGSHSYKQSDDDTEECMDLQITEMEVSPESGKSVAERLYGGG